MKKWTILSFIVLLFLELTCINVNANSPVDSIEMWHNCDDELRFVTNKSPNLKYYEMGAQRMQSKKTVYPLSQATFLLITENRHYCLGYMAGWSAAADEPFPPIVFVWAYVHYRKYHTYSHAISANEILNQMVHNKVIKKAMQNQTKSLQKVYRDAFENS